MRISGGNRAAPGRTTKRELRDRRAISAMARLCGVWKGGRPFLKPAQRRPRAAPAVGVACAPSLILPALAGMPAQFSIDGPDSALPEIAQALLDNGLLVSSDWTGNLRDSFENGMARYLRDSGADRMQQLSFTFTAWVTDDIEAMDDYLLPDQWKARHGNPEGRTVGGLGLRAEGYVHFEVEPRLKKLEGLHPGCGWSVFSVLVNALWETVGVFSPSFAEQFAEDCSGWKEDAENAEDQDQTSLDALHQTMPAEIFAPLFEQGAIEAALARPRKSKGYQEVLNTALQIRKWTEGREEAGKSRIAFNDLPYCAEGETCLPVMLRWNAEDAIGRVWDDWESILFSSERTFNVFAAVFQIGEPSLPDAIGRFRECVELLVAVDKLLDFFDAPSSRLMDVLRD